MPHRPPTTGHLTGRTRPGQYLIVNVSLAGPPIGVFSHSAEGKWTTALALQSFTCRAGRCTTLTDLGRPEHRPAASTAWDPPGLPGVFSQSQPSVSCPKWNWSQRVQEKSPTWSPSACRGECFFARATIHQCQYVGRGIHGTTP